MQRRRFIMSRSELLFQSDTCVLHWSLWFKKKILLTSLLISKSRHILQSFSSNWTEEFSPPTQGDLGKTQLDLLSEKDMKLDLLGRVLVVVSERLTMLLESFIQDFCWLTAGVNQLLTGNRCILWLTVNNTVVTSTKLRQCYYWPRLCKIHKFESVLSSLHLCVSPSHSNILIFFKKVKKDKPNL